MATTSLALGLAINLNPFMRFDGYYVLSDLLGIPNLHERSFVFGQWQLRRLVFGLDQPMPEPVPPSRRRFLIGFAWATWTYRFLLFLGIAFVVYHFFFKVLGVILFAIEIGWFIVLPIMRELRAWWMLRAAVREQRRVWISAGAVVSLTVVLFIPWSDRITLPAVLESMPHATIYAPAPGRIVEMTLEEGRYVDKGTGLITLESPALENEVALTHKRIEVEQLRGRRQFIDQQELAKHQVTLEALKARLTELEGLKQQQQTLSLVAPISGRVTDRAEALHVGRWINKELPLTYVVDPAGEELHAVAPETDVGYLRSGQFARFIPEGVERPSVRAQVVEIRDIDESSFTVPYLASLYGGEVPVREDGNHRLRPETFTVSDGAGGTIGATTFTFTVAPFIPPPGGGGGSGGGSGGGTGGSGGTGSGSGSGYNNTQDFFDPLADVDYSPLVGEVRHRVTATVVYELPWLRDRGDAIGGVLGGWQLSSVLNFRSGEPLRITQASGIANSRPDYNGGNQVFDDWRDTLQYLDRNAYTLIPTSPTTRATVRPGNQNSSQVRGPGRRRVDLTLAKTFTLRGTTQVQFRFESFNVFNWRQYNNPVTNVVAPNLGQITSVASSRTGQIGLRLTF
jgi:hypothetical protein